MMSSFLRTGMNNHIQRLSSKLISFSGKNNSKIEKKWKMASSHQLASFPALQKKNTLLIGLNKYKIMEMLGRGMYSTVRRAEDKRTKVQYVKNILTLGNENYRYQGSQGKT